MAQRQRNAAVAGLLAPITSVEAPVLHRFGNIRGGNQFVTFEIRNGAGDLQYTVVRSR
jgi:hypothetical protein